MKNLLHSKMFRRNLMKWLCMYCGVMCVLTIVITYSKYITSMSANDSAKVSIFDVDVSFNGCTDENIDNTGMKPICYYKSINPIRPIDELEFYFTVDTSKLEVNTLLYLYVTVQNQNNYFEIIDVLDVTSESEAISIPYDNISLEETDSTIRISDDIKAAQGKIKKYKVVMKYNYAEAGYDSELPFNDVIKVGYSATQKIAA